MKLANLAASKRVKIRTRTRLEKAIFPTVPYLTVEKTQFCYSVSPDLVIEQFIKCKKTQRITLEKMNVV